MVRDVNGRSAALRADRVAATEERLVAAATRLFLRHGYVGTTLTAVAEEAGVAPRTVYLRFGNKVALFLRAVDVALVGDTAPVDVAHRDWSRHALSAPSLDERIRQEARNVRDMFGRVGKLLAVAEEVAALEPSVAQAAQAGREATREHLRRFWQQAADDGLLPPGADVGWLADTAVMTCAADIFGFARKTLGWDAEAYARWLETTWRRMVAAADRPAPVRAGTDGHGRA